MIVELRLQIRVGKQLMDGIFQVACPLIQSRIDGFLDLNRGKAEHNPNEDKPKGNFDNGAQIHRFLLVGKPGEGLGVWLS
jgi:hypothetical protein